jgi:hypothetical protein
VIKSRIRWDEHAARMEEMRNAYRIFVGINEGNRLFRRYRCIWEDNIRPDLKEVGWEILDRCMWLKTETSSEIL